MRLGALIPAGLMAAAGMAVSPAEMASTTASPAEMASTTASSAEMVSTTASSAEIDQQPGWQWVDHTCGDCFSSVDVTSSVVWAGTIAAGVLSFDRATGQVTNYTDLDGLGGTWGWDISAAEDGHVWVATAEFDARLTFTGLSHFNGVSWESYDTTAGLPSNNIVVVEAAPGGAVWGGTTSGLAHYDGSHWIVYSTADGLPSDEITDIAAAPGGNVYVATPAGIGQFAGGAWSTLPTTGLPSSGIARVAASPAGELWALTAGVSGTPCSGGLVAHYSVDPSGQGFWSTHDLGLCDGSILEVTSDGRVWAGHDLELWVLDGGNWSQENAAADYAAEEPSSGSARWVVVDGDGDLWLPRTGVGIAHWDGRRWEVLTSGIGLSSLVPFSVDVGPGGEVWVGHFLGVWKSAVVEVFDGIGWRSFGQSEIGLSVQSSALGVTQRALDIGEDGLVWAGVHEAGLAWFDGATWASRPYTDSLRGAGAPAQFDGGIVAVASDHQGGAWIGSEVGAAHFDGSDWTWVTTADGLPDDAVHAVEVDPDTGEVWFGTEGGVAIWDGAVTAVFTQADGLAADSVAAIALDPTDDGVWIVSYEWTGGGGVSHYDGASWTVFTEADGLPSGSGWSIHVAESGDVWLAPYDEEPTGLGHYDGTTWRVYDREDGLVNDVVFDVTTDRIGRVWVATMLGVSELRTRPLQPTPTSTATPPTVTVEPPSPTVGATTPTPSGTPTSAATPAVPSPTPSGPHACDFILSRVPIAAINSALANPNTVGGYGERLDPGKPPGPMNPEKRCLSIRNPSIPWHPLFNPLVWKVGCP